MTYPWVDKEAPICSNQTLCPRNPNYTWDDYLDCLLNKGVKNFVLGGLMMVGSDIWFVIEFKSPSRWSKSGFMALREKVRARGGRILGDVIDAQYGYGEPFNKTRFRQNAAKFVEYFPVDGFRIADFLPYSDQTPQHVKEALEAINELKLISSIRLTPEKLDVFAKAKLGGIADTTFVSLWPRYDDKNDTAAFNTDAFAKQTILNASAAGVDLGKIVLQ
ncbi:hypothetical protein Pmar_PMAR026164, partial [Perkinsus marinus ATCC 50983]